MTAIIDLAIPDVKLLKPKLHRDDRGYVAEIVHEKQMLELGLPIKFMQENQSMSVHKNTVRGLHAQRSPHAQAKLVRVLQGRIWDVVVDVRRGSPSFGKHVGVQLSSDEVAQLYVPVGFLHGFCTLTDNAVVLYKMSNVYDPGSEVGVIWNDPDLNIPWPVKPAEAILSGKDEKLSLFKDFPAIEW